MNPLIEELTWRGLVHNIMPGTEEQLNKEMTSGYVGFDPTADSLHVGSLVPIFLLVHLQRHGEFLRFIIKRHPAHRAFKSNIFLDILFIDTPHDVVF